MISRNPASMLLYPSPSPYTSNAYDVPKKFIHPMILINETIIRGLRNSHCLSIFNTFFILASFPSVFSYSSIMISSIRGICYSRLLIFATLCKTSTAYSLLFRNIRIYGDSSKYSLNNMPTAIRGINVMNTMKTYHSTETK